MDSSSRRNELPEAVIEFAEKIDGTFEKHQGYDDEHHNADDVHDAQV